MHAGEGAHDLDIDLNGALASKDTGEHSHALLRKGVWSIPASAPSV
jgi:hypothetical protein